ncbi:IclR family transcriptional regulator [Saccharopolyspora sp. NPDC000995]
MSAKDEKSPESLTDRVFAVLLAFVDAPELGISDIHRRTGLDKSVVHRIVRSAVAHGFLVQDPRTRSYSVGLRAWEIGRGYGGADRVVALATPVLEELSKEHEVTCYLGRLDDLEIVYLALIDSPGPIRIVQEVGGRVPATTTAVGRALLAELDDAELHRRIDGRVAPADQERLLAKIAESRAVGTAVNRGEFTTGVASVGALVPSTTTPEPIGISAAFLLFDDNEGMWTSLPSAVQEAAARIARDLDGRPISRKDQR